MNRKIPNKPHPTPNPDKPHTSAGADRGNLARRMPNPHGIPAPTSAPVRSLRTEEPSYDSCFDDLNLVLSQSMQQPDPDPNLESSGGAAPEQDAIGPESGLGPAPRGRAPRTSEIFRSVVAPGGDAPPSSESALPAGLAEGPSGELAIPGLSVVDRSRDRPERRAPRGTARTTAGFPGARSCC